MHPLHRVFQSGAFGKFPKPETIDAPDWVYPIIDKHGRDFLWLFENKPHKVFERFFGHVLVTDREAVKVSAAIHKAGLDATVILTPGGSVLRYNGADTAFDGGPLTDAVKKKRGERRDYAVPYVLKDIVSLNV